MAKSKNKQSAQQSSNWTANYGQIKPEETADTQAIRNWKPANDPSIPYAFGRARNDITNSFANPLGADTPQSVRDAIQRSAFGELGQQEAQARSQESFLNKNLELSKLQYLDERTRPQIIQTSGSGNSSGTAVQTQHATPLGVISGIAQGALAF